MQPPVSVGFSNWSLMAFLRNVQFCLAFYCFANHFCRIIAQLYLYVHFLLLFYHYTVLSTINSY